MRTILHYESITIAPKALVSLFPSESTMKGIAGASTYSPSKLKVTPGPFIVTMRWDGMNPSDVFKFDLSNAADGFDLVRTGKIAAGKAIEICVENTSNEPATFEAGMSVETHEERLPRHPVDVMADDMAEDFGQGPLNDMHMGDAPHVHDETCFPGSGRNKTSGKGMKDRLKDALFGGSVEGVDVLGMPSLEDASNLGSIFKSRISAIVDNVLRAVEVVVRDAADKLDGSDEMDDLPPVVEPIVGRDMILGFNSKDGEQVPPGATANITSRPQVIFKMKKLIIPDAIADAFDIVDIKIGKNSQLATANPIAGSTFAVRKNGETFTTDTAQVSMDMTITVFNKTKEPMAFMAAAVGSMVDGGGYNASFAARLARVRRRAGRTTGRLNPFPPFFS
jgi:hypothetical protein